MPKSEPGATGEGGANATAAPKTDRLLAVLLAIAVFELWLLPLRFSFWLDETATFWIIKDGLTNTITRSIYWSGQSPLYYLIAWFALAVGGRQEIILRMPSILAMTVAAYLLYKLAARLFDAETAPMVVLVFISSEIVSFEAADARPYALGICMLIGSVFLLVRWLDSGRVGDAIGFASLAALTIYAHYLLAIALIVPGMYAIRRVLKERTVKLPTLMAIFGLVGLLLVPLVPQFLSFYRSRTSHSFSATPHFGEMLVATTPPVLVASLAFGFLLAWLIAPRFKGTGTARKETLLMVAGWVVLPPLFCYLISIFTDTKLFVPRYYSSNVPGIALIAGWIVRRFTTGLARTILAATVLLCGVMSFATVDHGREDWSGAMRTVRSSVDGPDMPVLVASGFIEASEPQALEDSKLKDVLFAPLALYPAGGSLIRLPYRLNDQSEAYLENVISTRLQTVNAFLFVGVDQGLTFEPWLRGRLATRGFHSKNLGRFGNVRVFLFSTGRPN